MDPFSDIIIRERELKS